MISLLLDKCRPPITSSSRSVRYSALSLYTNLAFDYEVCSKLKENRAVSGNKLTHIRAMI